MPGKIRKHKGKYQVIWGGKIRAKGTTKKKAEAQLRLLYAKEK
jgi:hypothetical protein